MSLTDTEQKACIGIVRHYSTDKPRGLCTESPRTHLHPAICTVTSIQEVLPVICIVWFCEYHHFNAVFSTPCTADVAVGCDVTN